MDERSPENIGDLLQQLRITVDNTETVSANDHTKDKRISNKQMQQELKMRYLSENAEYELPEEESDYALDADFLREIQRGEKKSRSDRRAEVPKPIAEETSFEDDIVAEDDMAPWENSNALVTDEAVEENEFIDEEELTEEEELIEEEELTEEEELIDEEELIEEEELTEEEELIEEEELTEKEELIDEEELTEEKDLIDEEELAEEEELTEEEELAEEEELTDEEELTEENDYIGYLGEDELATLTEEDEPIGLIGADELIALMEADKPALKDEPAEGADEDEIIDAEPLEEPSMQSINLASLGVPVGSDGVSEPPLEEESEEFSQEASATEADSEETLDDIDLMFETAQPKKQSADSSVVDLLLQFGCDDELEENVEEEHISEYLYEKGSDVPYDSEASYIYDGDEYVSREQDDMLKTKYRQAFFASVRRLACVSVLAFLVFLYDFLPLFGVDFPSVLDYMRYPVAYILIGLQLLFICCLPVWKKLWHSLCSLCRLQFDAYSIATASLLAVILYDLASLAMADYHLPPVFHFAVALGVVAAAVSDHLLLCRERITFLIYSGDDAAYTLLKSEGKDSILEKMRRGGLPNTHTVRMPTEVSFPNRYFRAVCEECSTRSAMYYLLVPLIVLSVLCGVGCMLIGNDLFSSLSAIFVVLLAALPSSAVLVDSIVLYAAAAKLAKKGSAIAGKGAIARYADTNLLVFRDLHLFAPCKSEDVGINFYDSANPQQVLACLKALYDTVGGPMAAVLSHVPSQYDKEQVKVLRMFRNGIESVIDRRHVLIVGDSQFMERYGFDFSDRENELRTKGRMTLCISLDGVMSAKMNVKYALEPLFEVLVERLAEDGVFCAVETQDPLIHSAMAAKLRSRGHTPISIVHKSARDLRRSTRAQDDIRREPTGILARRSRLRLAELVIFCKRLRSIRRKISLCTLIGGAVSFAVAALLLLLGVGEWANQYVLLLCHGITSALLLVAALCSLPGRDHISLSSYDREQENT